MESATERNESGNASLVAALEEPFKAGHRLVLGARKIVTVLT